METKELDLFDVMDEANEAGISFFDELDSLVEFEQVSHKSARFLAYEWGKRVALLAAEYRADTGKPSTQKAPRPYGQGAAGRAMTGCEWEQVEKHLEERWDYDEGSYYPPIYSRADDAEKALHDEHISD